MCIFQQSKEFSNKVVTLPSFSFVFSAALKSKHLLSWCKQQRFTTVYLLARPNPWAFPGIGACQIDRQSPRLFSTSLPCQIAETQSGICTHSHSFPSEGSHTQSGTHKCIHPHIVVCSASDDSIRSSCD